MSENDCIKLQNAIEQDLKHEHSLEDLKHICSAYTSEEAPTGGNIKYSSFKKSNRRKAISQISVVRLIVNPKLIGLREMVKTAVLLAQPRADSSAATRKAPPI